MYIKHIFSTLFSGKMPVCSSFKIVKLPTEHRQHVFALFVYFPQQPHSNHPWWQHIMVYFHKNQQYKSTHT